MGELRDNGYTKTVLFIKSKKIYWNTIIINISNSVAFSCNKHIKNKTSPLPHTHTNKD